MNNETDHEHSLNQLELARELFLERAQVGKNTYYEFPRHLNRYAYCGYLNAFVEYNEPDKKVKNNL